MKRLTGFAAAAGLGMIVAMAVPAVAQTTDGGIFVPGGDSASAPKDKPKEKPLESDTATPPQQKDDSDPDAGEGEKKEVAPDSASDKPEPKPEDGAEGSKDKKEPEPGQGLEQRVKSVEQRIQEARSEIASLRDQVAQNARAIEELRMLIEQDREVEPKPGENLPPLNADCQGDENCVDCLLGVETELGDLLRLFEKLRAIYARYKETHEKAIFLGDTLSGYHDVSETVWGGVKVQMMAGLKNLQRAYDAKFREFMGDLDRILKRADACLPPGSPPVSSSYDARILKNMLNIAYKRND